MTTPTIRHWTPARITSPTRVMHDAGTLPTRVLDPGTIVGVDAMADHPGHVHILYVPGTPLTPDGYDVDESAAACDATPTYQRSLPRSAVTVLMLDESGSYTEAPEDWPIPAPTLAPTPHDVSTVGPLDGAMRGQTRAECSCGWSGDWTRDAVAAERDAARHGVGDPVAPERCPECGADDVCTACDVAWHCAACEGERPESRRRTMDERGADDADPEGILAEGIAPFVLTPDAAILTPEVAEACMADTVSVTPPDERHDGWLVQTAYGVLWVPDFDSADPLLAMGEATSDLTPDANGWRMAWADADLVDSDPDTGWGWDDVMRSAAVSTLRVRVVSERTVTHRVAWDAPQGWR